MKRNSVGTYVALSVLAGGCGGNSHLESDHGGPSHGGSAGTSGTATGGTSNAGTSGTAAGGTNSAGASQGGSAGTGSVAVCESGKARCNSAGMRETCNAQGMWETTNFSCAVNVAVADDIGAYCVTKGDGTYRCWGGDAMGELPPDRYVRVQITGRGDDSSDGPLPIVGLTDDDRLLSVGFELPSDTPPVAAFRATNMGGLPSVCPLLRDGTFRIIRDFPEDAVDPRPVVLEDGLFFRAFCVWEGLTAGIHTDGTMWSSFIEVLPGNDWVDVAHSVGIFCGIRASGDIACGPSALGSSVPSFPPGRYRSITATGGTACALDEGGLLVCQRYDGEVMAIDGGPFTFIEGGKDVLCGIREDGSVSCFRHGGNGFPENVTPFVPIEPLNDPDW